MKVLVSFADKKYEGSQKALTNSAMKFGIDHFYNYGPESLKFSQIEKEDIFYKRNQAILCQPRGCGYWIWKPYIISETIKTLNEGDIILYSDAAVKVISDLTPLFDLITEERGIILFEQADKNHINKIWTKRDCFKLMNCDEEKYWNGVQLTATFSLWRADQRCLDFLKEWQNYLENPLISTDFPTTTVGNFKEFKDHRHDQSVLSIMSQKYSLERFRDPSQWGNNDYKENSKYGQIFNHHRMKLFG